MTGRVHAIIAKRIINHDAGGRPIVCCWDDCDRPATELYKAVQHEHLRGIPCSDVDAGVGGGRHYHIAFCSAGHLDLFRNSTGTNALVSLQNTGRAYGNHSAGSRGTIL